MLCKKNKRCKFLKKRLYKDVHIRVRPDPPHYIDKDGIHITGQIPRSIHITIRSK